jgi:hypothetical protein
MIKEGNFVSISQRNDIENSKSLLAGGIEPRKRIIPLAGMVILAGLIAGAVPLMYIACGFSLEWKDTLALFAPLRGEIVGALRNFHLPLWNPHEAMGMPLLAQMLHGVLHPVSLMAAFLAPDASLNALIVVQVALAAAGTCLLALCIGISPYGALLAGIAFGTSGYTLSMSANYMYLVGAASAPWAIAGIYSAAGRRTWLTLLFSALGTTLVLFAGDPQWAALALCIGITLVIAKYGLKALAWPCTGALIGILISGIQLVPTMFLWSETARSAGVLIENRAEWALSLWRLPELIAPGFFSGTPGESLVAPVYLWLGNPGTRFPIPFATSIFVGTTVIVLAAYGMRRNRTTRTLGITAVVLLWIALGPGLGADQLLRYVPLWGSFRYAEKMVGPFTFCLSLMAGFGLDPVSSGVRRSFAYACLGAIAALGVALLFLWTRDPAASNNLLPVVREGAQHARRQLMLGLAYPISVLIIITGILIASRRFERVTLHLGLLIVILMAVESAAASRFAVHLGEQGVRSLSPLGEITQKDAMARVIHPAPVDRGYGPLNLDESDRLAFVESTMALPSYNVAGGLDTFDAYTGLMPKRFKALDLALAQNFPDERWLVMRRFAATHVAVPRVMSSVYEKRVTAALIDADHIRKLTDPWIDVWEVPHRPWALFAGTAVRAGSADDALQTLIDIVRRGGSEVVVEGQAPFPVSSGQILQASRGTESVRIEATSPGDALLIVNDACWPGWDARIDGIKAPILCADAAVRAVPWPAGHHILEMAYHPPEIQYGISVTITGVLVLLALCLYSEFYLQKKEPVKQ